MDSLDLRVGRGAIFGFLGMMLQRNQELFLDPDLEGPLPAEEREDLLGDIPWGVFTLIARIRRPSLPRSSRSYTR